MDFDGLEAQWLSERSRALEGTHWSQTQGLRQKKNIVQKLGWLGKVIFFIHFLRRVITRPSRILQTSIKSYRKVKPEEVLGSRGAGCQAREQAGSRCKLSPWQSLNTKRW